MTFSAKELARVLDSRCHMVDFGVEGIRQAVRQLHRDSNDELLLNEQLVQDWALMLTALLRGHGLTKILIEREYIDLDFLEDYSHFHALSYRTRTRYCRRLHFFSHGPDSVEDLVSLLLTSSMDNPQQLSESLGYLGFAVLRSLPESFFGKLAIKPYIHDSTTSFIPVTRRHVVNLFGLELEFDGLIMQQQDGMVSSCAISALYSTFQATSHLFGHRAPSPVAIARAASLPSSKGRAIPSKQLELEEICQAVRAMGLEVDVFEPASLAAMCSFCYAYCRGGFPVLAAVPILAARFEESRSAIPSSGRLEAKAKPVPVGGHAVCVTGYKLLESDLIQRLDQPTELDGRVDIKASPYRDMATDHQLLLRSYAVERLYVHDDQQGPYSTWDRCNRTGNIYEGPPEHRYLRPSLVMERQKETTAKGPVKVEVFHTSLGRDREIEARIKKAVEEEPLHAGRAMPESRTHEYSLCIGRQYVVSPVHPQIRLPYASVLGIINELNSLLAPCVDKLADASLPAQLKRGREESPPVVLPGDRLVWDFYLGLSNDYKRGLRLGQGWSSHALLDALSLNMPRFIWIVEIFLNDRKLADLILDSTHVSPGDLLIGVLVANDGAWEDVFGSLAAAKKGQKSFDVGLSARSIITRLLAL